MVKFALGREKVSEAGFFEWGNLIGNEWSVINQLWPATREPLSPLLPGRESTEAAKMVAVESLVSVDRAGAVREDAASGLVRRIMVLGSAGRFLGSRGGFFFCVDKSQLAGTRGYFQLMLMEKIEGQFRSRFTFAASTKVWCQSELGNEVCSS